MAVGWQVANLVFRHNKNHSLDNSLDDSLKYRWMADRQNKMAERHFVPGKRRRGEEPGTCGLVHAVLTSVTKPFYLHVISVFTVHVHRSLSSREHFGNTFCICLISSGCPEKHFFLNFGLWTGYNSSEQRPPPRVAEKYCHMHFWVKFFPEKLSRLSVTLHLC